MIALLQIVAFLICAIAIAVRSRQKVAVFSIMIAASAIAALVENASSALFGVLFVSKGMLPPYVSSVTEESVRFLALLFGYRKILERSNFGFWEGAFSGLCFGLVAHALGIFSLVGNPLPSECSVSIWPGACAYSLLVTPMFMHILIGTLYAPVIANWRLGLLTLFGAAVLHFSLNYGASSLTQNPTILFDLVGYSHTLSLIFLGLTFIVYRRSKRRAQRI